MTPRIVFLDRATVDLGDLSMAPITRSGRYQAYPYSSTSEVVKRSRQAEIVIANKCLFDRQTFQSLPNLRLLCVAATGVNNVDLEAARERGIAVTNVAGYSTTTVAEQTIMFLLALSHRLVPHHEASLSGRWSRSPTFTLLDYPFSDLAGKSLGIIGYGTIGRTVARLARALGMKILVARLRGRKYGAGPRRLPLSELLARADFVSLHCNLSDKTYHLIGRRELRQMRPTASLLNLARGPVVDEGAVAQALVRNRLAGYAADVLAREPPPRGHPFFKKGVREKVLLSPHIAWASRESRQRLVQEIGRNIKAFLEGKRRNRVD